MSEPNAVALAEQYYDSSDADTFYSTVWGGTDIHIGLYETPEEDIATASHRTVTEMAGRLSGLNRNSRVLDMGAGYGGSARHLAREFGSAVTCLNLSETQNAANRKANATEGLDDLVKVVHGSFENVPDEAASYDVVWSQDAILHSADRPKVLDEVARVARPAAEFIITDPMQSDDCPEGVLQPILDRIHLSSLASPGFYKAEMGRRGFSLVSWQDNTQQLRNHYASVRRVLESRYEEMTQKCSKTYVDNMLVGLQHWVDGADKGYLSWGFLHFRRG